MFPCSTDNWQEPICQKDKFVKINVMSSRLFAKFRSTFYGKLHLRHFGKSKKKKDEKGKCVNKTCGEPKPKKSIWNVFGGGSQAEEEMPSREGCRRLIAKQACEPDPDLSEFGGTAYKTCGSAYLVQKDLVEKPKDTAAQPEDTLVARLERHPSLKDVEDPMPPFESVEQRMIKLCELGLHPAYKRYMSMPKPQADLTLPKHPYKSRSGPIADDEYPPHLKLSKECLDRKNIFAEFKRATPPRQMMAKMLEMRQNQRPTLERKDPAQKDQGKAEEKKVKC